ncbi:LIPOPROTEIN [Mycoplasmopsis pulmonis]|uniref:LIPOPROTEIN n=1 Tax=Mycoplasmopsis pulmonis (strain UAB CTIP) TaxID=272635 RepID=Q98QA1_MYCPU|nr:hypothetical protein [Mycoplasmopsis pulmonis]CAC13638.1 LIPOPROTEIN [Mycoplasmopsis pulmonis]VEU68229.1 Uncharacterised protein [Mycoplasmopsis pulmonis]
MKKGFLILFASLNLTTLLTAVACNVKNDSAKNFVLKSSDLISISEKFQFKFKNNLDKNQKIIEGVITFINSETKEIVKKETILNLSEDNIIFSLLNIENNAKFQLDEFVSKDEKFKIKFQEINFSQTEQKITDNISSKEDEKNKNPKDNENSNNNSSDQKNDELQKNNSDKLNDNVQDEKANKENSNSNDSKEKNDENTNKIQQDQNQQKEDQDTKQIEQEKQNNLNSNKNENLNNSTKIFSNKIFDKLTLINSNSNKHVLVFNIKNSEELKDKNKLTFSIDNKNYEKEFYSWEKNIFIQVESPSLNLENVKEFFSKLLINDKYKISKENITFDSLSDSHENNSNLAFEKNEIDFKHENNNLIINFKNPPLFFKENQRFILEFKPYQHNYDFNLKFIATFKNKQLIVENVNWLSKFYNKFYLTNIYSANLEHKYNIPEFINFDIKSNFEIQIQRIKVEKTKDFNSFKMQFELKNNEDISFYKNKYFALHFNEKKLANIKNTNFVYGKNFVKYYSYEEIINTLLINSFPENNIWKLIKIDLVYKEDLSLIKELWNSENKRNSIELNFLVPQEKNDTKSFTNNINFENKDNDSTLDLKQVEQVDLTKNNYLSVNDFYLKILNLI